ncbi:MAG TPA: hypothetical protein VH247_03100 [Thermoleophilaceae bacterium]|nr:hypothetical protein [Thermoleophilaceae bacterium]
MPGSDRRLVELLQSARPMRLFRGCRQLSGEAIAELTTLTPEDGDPERDPVAAVGHAVRRAKRTPLTDGARLRSDEIDTLLSRLGA